MSVARHHAEWLSLVEVSGPFLAMRVLDRVFPQGLDDHPSEVRQRLQVAHEEWLDNQEGLKPDPALHRAWIRYVLREALGYDERDLVEGQALPASLTVSVPEHHEILRPTYAVIEPAGRDNAGAARLLIDVLPSSQNLEHALAGRAWKASPATRMMTLLHGASGAAPGESQKGARLGLVTNGRHWMLVHAVPGETTTYASFYSHLFFEEPLTLRAFQSLLALRRFFGVAAAETLESLFVDSSQDQHEVTDQLGLQVRRAVEVLVQAIDRIDRGDKKRALLRGVDEAHLYQAAVTVMMRLVFLFAAEERGLLLLGNEIYDQHYAVSTLRDQLQEIADKQGEEVLERRYEAWCRLLATFRAVHSGVRHENLPLPAYGGSLFDPDRFAFLEGRLVGSSWKEASAARLPPLAIDDRTVLHLLRSLQHLEMRVGGGRTGARRLSFRALDVEQIGHVYEGLLDHTAKRAKGPVVSLEGKHEPEIAIADLEAKRAGDTEALVEWLAEETGRSQKAVTKALEYRIPQEDTRRLLVACENLQPLYGRVAPWAGLVRRDSAGNPVIIQDGAIYVTGGAERRATGTHYTPRSLTEPIVQHTLDPLVYEGPIEGWPRIAWRLRTPKEILGLRVCDMAMGSGAFLVQACRYLSERLVEAWEDAEKAAGGKLVVTPAGELAKGEVTERALAVDTEERLTLARRYVADRCLYGVDKNPMAVEMAKLSLWLVTLQKDRPFTFIDHALRCGDSLLGLTQTAQLERFHIDPDAATTMPLGAQVFRQALDETLERRRQLEGFSVETIRDAAEKMRLLSEAEAAIADMRAVADLIVGASLATASKRASALAEILEDLGPLVAAAFDPKNLVEERRARIEVLRERALEQLKHRTPFHWILEFPEVLVETAERPGGFDAIVGNPPFQGGMIISTIAGTDYREYLVRHVAAKMKGHADLCAYFFLRSGELIRDRGGFGLIATNTIAQGVTREVGLDQLVGAHFSIPRAVASRPWPGHASLQVAHVWGHKGTWQGQCVLDDSEVQSITPFLVSARGVGGNPERLRLNSSKSFIGSYVLGAGFVLSPDEATALIGRDKSSAEVLYPYLNGDDINSRSDQSSSRWVIQFDERDEGAARRYADVWRIAEERIKPERMTKDAIKYPRMVHEWWKHWNNRRELKSATIHLPRVLVRARVSSTHAFAFVSSKLIGSEQVVFFALSDFLHFCVLQSTIHEAWVISYASTLGAGTRYTPSDCFETFPLSDLPASLDPIGERYHQHRRSAMLARNEGLTKIYNRFHVYEERAPDIKTLRDLHVEMDEAVAAAYGWTDLRFDHGFKDTKQGRRFTLSETARREVLDRLLRLNHQRYAEEVAAGLHDKDARKKAKPTKTTPDVEAPSTAASQLDLFASARPALLPASAPQPARGLDHAATAVLAFLRKADDPMSKADIFADTGIAESAWKTVIDRLKADGLVEQVGERRGARYRPTGKQTQKDEPFVRRPDVDAGSDARLVLCSLVQTRGGRAAWAEVMTAFALVFQPDSLLRHAPDGMKTLAKQWASRAKGRVLTRGLLREAAAQLARDGGLRSEAVGASGDRVLIATEAMAPLSVLPQWYQEEAQLAFAALAGMKEGAVSEMADVLAVEDRQAVA
jgi:hypothetical protein